MKNRDCPGKSGTDGHLTYAYVLIVCPETVSQLCGRCQRSLESEDTALTSSAIDVTNKCPRVTPDYSRASYLSCDYAVPSCRHHGGAHRPTSLCPSHADADDTIKVRQTAALDVVTSHTAASRDLGEDEDEAEDRLRHLSASRCHCVRQCHVTRFGTFSSPQLAPMTPPT